VPGSKLKEYTYRIGEYQITVLAQNGSSASRKVFAEYKVLVGRNPPRGIPKLLDVRRKNG
jgi:hypothetical protein